MQKIKLTVTLPINQRHGCIEGAIFEVLRDGSEDRIPGIWITSLAGEEVKVLRREFEPHYDPLSLEKSQEVYDRLSKHDWHYSFADDGKAFRRGEVAHNELLKFVRELGPEAMTMFHNYQDYVNSLIGSSPLPKPERPGGEKNDKGLDKNGLWF